MRGWMGGQDPLGMGDVGWGEGQNRGVKGQTDGRGNKGMDREVDGGDRRGNWPPRVGGR